MALPPSSPRTRPAALQSAGAGGARITDARVPAHSRRVQPRCRRCVRDVERAGTFSCFLCRVLLADVPAGRRLPTAGLPGPYRAVDGMGAAAYKSHWDHTEERVMYTLTRARRGVVALAAAVIVPVVIGAAPASAASWQIIASPNSSGNDVLGAVT